MSPSTSGIHELPTTLFICIAATVGVRIQDGVDCQCCYDVFITKEGPPALQLLVLR